MTYREIPEGNPGVIATLDRIAELIREPALAVSEWADHLADVAEQHGAGDLALAEMTFEWVRLHMVYVEDQESHGVADEIRTPEYLLHEISRLGHAIGDCDDFVLLLGALYKALGFGVFLVAIGLADENLEHVYLHVVTPEGQVAADPIRPEDFGWEVAEEDRTAQYVLEV
ncbi:MAG: hypothetical protein ACREA0_32330 [bacterium]